MILLAYIKEWSSVNPRDTFILMAGIAIILTFLLLGDEE